MLQSLAILCFLFISLIGCRADNSSGALLDPTGSSPSSIPRPTSTIGLTGTPIFQTPIIPPSAEPTFRVTSNPSPTPTKPVSFTPTVSTGELTPTANETPTGESGCELIVGTGFRMLCPPEWSIGEQKIASEFSNGSECATASIVDWQPPNQSGQSPGIFESIVQVCGKPTDGRSMEEFLTGMYGESVGGCEAESLDEIQTYRSNQSPTAWTLFVQSDSNRYQILVSIVAFSEVENRRIEQANEMLDSISAH